MTDLTGKIALVTGGGRGVGAATALALADAGADVAVLARDTCELTAIVELIRAKGRRSLGVTADVGDWDAVQAGYEEILEYMGEVAILVNNAAVVTPIAIVDDAHPQEWAQTVTTNLTGTFYCTHAVLTAMLEAKWGRIITITSSASTIPRPAQSAYAASMAGIEQFMRVLATEVATTGVVSTLVNPDEVLPQNEESSSPSPDHPDSAMYRAYHRHVSVRPPEECARLITWLCGEAGVAYQGQTAHVSANAIRTLLGLPALS